MLFNSLIFTVFLPLVFALYWLIPPRFRNYFLLLASYYFYFSYNPYFLLLLVGTTVFDYYLALGISNSENNSKRKTLLVLSLFSNLGVLFIFKYFVFFYNSGVESFHLTTRLLQQVVIPAGLSFYTFQSLSYILDVYRRKYMANDRLTDFLLFVSFFPHMVAGPIVRYESLMPQLKLTTYFKNIPWGDFARLVVWGYFKKLVIADQLSKLVSGIFNDVTHYSSFELLLGGFLFVIQVYCDFSGYSDIATGVAKLFNINLSLNWRRPLFSRSLKEFWQRNHISITTWFRDYLYIGLGGNRVSYGRWLLNIFLVFLISGLWHGANFTFLLWGAMHGTMYLLEILINKRFPNWKAPALLGWLYLISFHTLSLIAFRANSITDLSYMYRSIFSFSEGYFDLSQLIAQGSGFYFCVVMFSILLLVMKEWNEEFATLNRYPTLYRFAKPTAYVFFVLLIFIFGNFSANTFIYFQF